MLLLENNQLQNDKSNSALCFLTCYHFGLFLLYQHSLIVFHSLHNDCFLFVLLVLSSTQLLMIFLIHRALSAASVGRLDDGLLFLCL